MDCLAPWRARGRKTHRRLAQEIFEPCRLACADHGPLCQDIAIRGVEARINELPVTRDDSIIGILVESLSNRFGKGDIGFFPDGPYTQLEPFYTVYGVYDRGLPKLVVAREISNSAEYGALSYPERTSRPPRLPRGRLSLWL